MGGLLSCFNDSSTPQRLQYDMTPIKTRSAPIMWLIGPPGSGKRTQARLICEHFQFENIDVPRLIKTESEKETDRGLYIKDILNHQNKKIADTMVIDLIKEELLRKSKAKGLVLSNFPRTSKQALLFVKEITDVDIIIYLSTDADEMMRRFKDKSQGQIDDALLRKTIQNYSKVTKHAISKFRDKTEKISSNEPPTEVFRKIESKVNIKVGTKTKILSESDYAQSQNQEPNMDKVSVK